MVQPSTNTPSVSVVMNGSLYGNYGKEVKASSGGNDGVLRRLVQHVAPFLRYWMPPTLFGTLPAKLTKIRIQISLAYRRCVWPRSAAGLAGNH